MKNISIKVLIVFILFSVTFSCKGHIKTDNKIENIIQQMTLKEKLDFIGGYEAFNITGRLDVKVIDDKIRRILRMYERFDYFNNPVISKGFSADTAFIHA